MNFLRLARRLPPPRLIRPLSTSPAVCSGHNKWSKIKKQKGANDMKKSMIYAKATRDIAVAIRQGGSADPELNTALAAVMKRARVQGVPKDTIDSSIKRIVEKGNAPGAQAIVYEAMVDNIGILIECLSDNPNRTVLKIRNILTRQGARFGNISFMFQRKGLVRVSLQQGDDFEQRLERLIETALEADAEDFEQEDSSEGVVEIEFKCQPTSLAKLTSAVTAPGLSHELITSELVYEPMDVSEPPDEETDEKVSQIVESLEENEDTLRVWTTLG